MTGPPKQAAQYARRRWLLSGHAPTSTPNSRPTPRNHCVLSRVTDATGSAASLDSPTPATKAAEREKRATEVGCRSTFSYIHGAVIYCFPSTGASVIYGHAAPAAEMFHRD